MIEQLITDHLDLWSSAVRPKSSAGRGSNSKLELTGIKKLRELILELAVRGKLVPQDPSDEPASVLLERIAAEKARLVKEGKIKKSKPLPEITEDEKPFELPEGWVFRRLEDVFYPISVSKNKVKTSELLAKGKFPVVDQGQGFVAGFVDDARLVNKIPGPVIVFGDHTTNLKYIDFDFVAGADGVKILRPLCCCERYFYLVCNTLPIESRGYGRHYSRLLNNIFSLPPLAEQHRIVAKVDELMSLCDQLEQKSEASLAAHQTLVETLLATLTESADSGELAQNWARLAQHFDSLFTTQSSIDALKQTILQLAVMGKLVPQDPNDEPASVLMERIAAEKARLIKEGKIKKEKPLPPISEEEKPFALPDGWEWCRLEDVVDIQSGITKGRNLTGRKLVSIPYLSVANVQRGYVDLIGIKTIELPEDEINKYKVIARDLLITEGGDWDKVGRTAIWKDQIPYVAHQNHVFKARILLQEQDEVWLEKFLNGPFARDYFAGSSKQTTNLASINKTQLRGCLIAVPPREEKERIVSKVDELMSLCDQLSARMQASQTTQLHLAEALVEGALN